MLTYHFIKSLTVQKNAVAITLRFGLILANLLFDIIKEIV